MYKKRLGLVLGRFQPLHAGHLHLIRSAFKENDEVVICIGSAQRADPLSIGERYFRIEKQLQILGYRHPKLRKVCLINDPEPMDSWPEYVKEHCGITDKTNNTFYRSEALPERYEGKLRQLGFAIRIVKRAPFYYRAPDGFYYLVSSTTEIREIHKKLNNAAL